MINIKEVLIDKDLNSGRIDCLAQGFELASHKPPLAFSLSFKKIPHQIADGSMLQGMVFDRINPKNAPILEQASQLRHLPLEKRPRALSDLIRTVLRYPSSQDLEELKILDPEKAQVLVKISDQYISSLNKINFSEVVETGFAICRHFAASFVFLAPEAGMKAAFCTNMNNEWSSRMLNVYRQDDQTPLFSSVPPEQYLKAGHSWAEVELPDKWIPVDPTKNLVGDNTLELQTFSDALYSASAEDSLDIQDVTPEICVVYPRELSIPVAAPTASQEFHIRARDFFETYRGDVKFYVQSKPSELGVQTALTDLAFVP